MSLFKSKLKNCTFYFLRTRPNFLLNRPAFFTTSEDGEKPENEAKENLNVEESKKLTSLISSKYPHPVLATPVHFPFFPGMHTFLPVTKDLNFKSSSKEVAYFLTKKLDVSAEINSLDDIHRVGSFGYATTFPNYPFGADSSSNYSVGKKFIYEMNALRTVEAVHFDKGYVVLREYGDEAISSLKFNKMPMLMKEKFLALRRAIFNMNEKRLRHANDLNTFTQTKSAETVEHLRALVGVLFPYEASKMQYILELTQIYDVIDELTKFVAHQSILYELNNETNKRIIKKTIDIEKKYFLKEQLNYIQGELGINPESDSSSKFKEKITDLMPDYVKEVIENEIIKLNQLGPSHHESENSRNYLHWLTSYPWGKKSEDNFDLDKAKKIMDEDHFGLKDVKDRIIEFIATGKLKDGVTKGKILCFVGPPGVGKTSMGKSIARALGKEFVSMSVGGTNDPNEIKGHRRTYIGSMPGKIVQLIKKAKTVNPLFMIDEIDKIGRDGIRGDVSATLLELFDLTQNNEFSDNFMDIPIDLSQVLFICTANESANISRPLADRIEFIRLSGYINSEKIAISERHLIPKSLADSGLDEKKVAVTRKAIEHIIKWYCREPGVRNLERSFQKIFRKIAVKVVKNEKETFSICENDIEGYLGKKLFTRERFYEQTPVGVAMGLAWSEMGGSTLYIETEVIGQTKEKSGINFKATGSLGKVMNESITIAFSVAQNCLSKLDKNVVQVDGDFFAQNLVHIHFPEGAVPKDGPSAGIAMVTALISLVTKVPIKNDLAMTGEISLIGQVLPIGGVKEKVLSAKRSAVTEVILPNDNLAHWEELDAEIKEGMTVHFVKTVADVLKIAFPAFKWI